MRHNILNQIYNRPETVFTIDEIAQLSHNVSNKSLLYSLYYFTKTNQIKRLHHGIYSKINYNPLELANKVYKPSYISLETVLFKNGVIFQTYQTIFLASYLTRTISIGQTNLQFRKIKNIALTNMQGIEPKIGYFWATLERAFLDALYIYKDYHFDNLNPIDWKKVESLKHIYHSKALEKRVADYYSLYKEDHG